MPLLSAIAAQTGRMLVPKLLSGAGKALGKNNATAYELELIKLIDASIQEYSQQFPAPETGRIAFYQSQVFFEALLSFRLTQQIDTIGRTQLIQADHRILVPAREELNAFFAIFDRYIKASKKLSKLNIQDNYQEAIFEIARNLKFLEDSVTTSVHAVLEEIRSSGLSPYADHTIHPIVYRHTTRQTHSGTCSRHCASYNNAPRHHTRHLQMVFSPDKIAGAASGDAGNLLQAIPLGTVDKDGNITLEPQLPFHQY
jgi:hypothetical protein